MANMRLTHLFLNDAFPGQANQSIGIPTDGWDNTIDNFNTADDTAKALLPPMPIGVPIIYPRIIGMPMVSVFERPGRNVASSPTRAIDGPPRICTTNRATAPLPCSRISRVFPTITNLILPTSRAWIKKSITSGSRASLPCWNLYDVTAHQLGLPILILKPPMHVLCIICLHGTAPTI